MITVNDICKDLNVSTKALLNRMHYRGIMPKKEDGQYSFSEEEAMDLLDSNIRKNAIILDREILESMLLQGESLRAISRKIGCSPAGIRDFFYKGRDKEKLRKEFNIRPRGFRNRRT